MSVLDINTKPFGGEASVFKLFGNVEYPYVAIAPRYTVTRSRSS